MEKIGIMKQKWPMWRLYRNKPGVAQPFYVTTTKGTFKKSALLQLFSDKSKLKSTYFSSQAEHYLLLLELRGHLSSTSTWK